jgi:hypothetical protein
MERKEQSHLEYMAYNNYTEASNSVPLTPGGREWRKNKENIQ